MNFRAVAYVNLIVLCMLTFLPATAIAHQTMTLSKNKPDGLSLIQIDCDPKNGKQSCIISGARITLTKPLVAVNGSSSSCYLEVGSSTVELEEHNGVYIAHEGPEGSMCKTQLITTIDFKNKKYTTRRFSDNHDGEFCKNLDDEKNEYVVNSTLPLLGELQLKCSTIEATPSLWAP